MNRDDAIEQLLRWRLARAEADAPPAPRAARLLEQVRPWWELWPERFRSHVDRLGRMPLAYGYAMAAAELSRNGHPVPALIVRADEVETFARVLYFSVRDGRLRLRFQLDAMSSSHPEPVFETTFVPDRPGLPPFADAATLASSGEYRLDTELPTELVPEWTSLRVTDRLPFRLILRPTVRDL